MDKKVFSLEHQYQLYLKRCNITEQQMHPAQRKETKQAFFGAIGQILLVLREDMYELSEDEAVQVMEGMINEVSQHFVDITTNKN
jgi:hypothetical protein